MGSFVLKFSPYFICLLFFCLSSIISLFFHTPILILTHNIYVAVVLHCVLSFSILLGFLFFKFRYINVFIPCKSYFFSSRKYFYFSIFFSVLGLFSVIYSAIKDGDVSSYLNSFFSLETGIRESFELGSVSGGVPGYIKLLSYGPLAVFLNSVSFIFFNNNYYKRDKYLIYSFIISLICLLFKVVFSLDRLSLVSVLLVGFTYTLKNFKIKYLLYLLVIFAFINIISLLRLQNFGIFQFFVLYGQLGLNNFQLVLDTNSDFSFGFQTLLHPLYFIFKFFNIPFPIFNHNISWDWNPAQYLFSYLYMDFGYFSFLFSFFLGYYFAFLENRSFKQTKGYLSVYFIVMYLIISFIGVPAFRGLEFWYAISVSLFLSRFVKSINLYL